MDQVAATGKTRIGYIDAIRGFTMLLVVYAHIELFSLGVSFNKTVLGSLFVTFRMPMFFFISGFIAYKSVEWNREYYKSMLKKKSRVQIIPTFFFWCFSVCLCHGGNVKSFFIDGPGGYWFTIVLFYMFCIYYTVMFLCRMVKTRKSDYILILLSVVGALAYIGGMKYYDLNQYPLLCLINLSRYFEFFVLGLLCRKYQDTFFHLLDKDPFRVFLLLTFFILFTITWNKYLIQYSLIQIFNLEFLLRYLGLFLVFTLFYHYRGFFDSDFLAVKSLRFVGRRTLDIYLLHYFFLPSKVLNLYPLFDSKVGVNPKDTVLEFTILIVLTILVIACCLLVSAIIRSSSVLGHYLLGAKYIEK